MDTTIFIQNTVIGIAIFSALLLTVKFISASYVPRVKWKACSSQIQWEFSSRIVSTIHSCISVVFASIILSKSWSLDFDVFGEHAIQFELAYFIYDTLFLPFQYWEIGFWFHHFVCAGALIVWGNILKLPYLFALSEIVEMGTPLLNVMWALDVLDITPNVKSQKRKTERKEKGKERWFHSFYTILGLFTYFIFFFGRLILHVLALMELWRFWEVARIISLVALGAHLLIGYITCAFMFYAAPLLYLWIRKDRKFPRLKEVMDTIGNRAKKEPATE